MIIHLLIYIYFLFFFLNVLIGFGKADDGSGSRDLKEGSGDLSNPNGLKVQEIQNYFVDGKVSSQCLLHLSRCPSSPTSFTVPL